MHSGNEPQLGGRALDNSPMISSVIRKVVADARGAYLAGNLRALWERMYEVQQQRFHRELVRQELWYADQLVPPDSEHRAQRACLDIAHEWLNTGSEESIERMHAASEEVRVEWRQDKTVETVSLTARYIASLVTGIVPDAIGDEVPSLAAKLSDHTNTIEKVKEGMERIGAIRAAKRWQVETAWAILNGRALPPLHPDDMDSPYAAYWSDRDDLLVKFMDEEQRLAFRQAVVRQVLWYTEQVIPPEAEDQGERECFEAARRWLDDPTPEHAEAAERLYQENRLRAQEGPPSLKAAVYTAWTASAALGTTQGMAASLATWPAMELQPERFPNPKDAHAITLWWRREAIWAILNGKALPPIDPLRSAEEYPDDLRDGRRIDDDQPEHPQNDE